MYGIQKNQMFKEINKLNPRKAFPALVFYSEF